MSIEHTCFSTHSFANMIHIHIDNTDIYVNISMKNLTRSTRITSNGNEHIYDNLLDKNDDYHRKNYTLQQILDNVETIQKEYEQIRGNSITSCFFSLKQLTKLFKNFQVLPNKTTEEAKENDYIENKSPFIFGGETLQWIALPQYNDHIYENDLIN
jgi:hypothetical protein